MDKRKTFGVLIEGHYGDKTGRITPHPKSKRPLKRKAEVMTALWWFLKYAKAKRLRVIRKKNGSYGVGTL